MYNVQKLINCINIPSSQTLNLIYNTIKLRTAISVYVHYNVLVPCNLHRTIQTHELAVTDSQKRNKH
jgi:hypothetical protein